jgi:hypothetical protein
VGHPAIVLDLVLRSGTERRCNWRMPAQVELAHASPGEKIATQVVVGVPAWAVGKLIVCACDTREGKLAESTVHRRSR